MFELDDVVVDREGRYGIVRSFGRKDNIFATEAVGIQTIYVPEKFWKDSCFATSRDTCLTKELELVGTLKPYDKERVIAAFCKGDISQIVQYDFRCASFDNEFLNMDLSGFRFYDVSFRCATFENVKLCGCVFKNCNFEESILRNVLFDNSYCRTCNFTHVKILDSALQNTVFTSSQFHRALVRKSQLKTIRFEHCDFSSAEFYFNCMKNIYTDEETAFFNLQCPEEGAFIGYKKAFVGEDCQHLKPYIIKLLITEDALRSSATTRKCRCSKAKVLSITTLDGADDGTRTVCSDHDPTFKYTVGETVEVKDFDTNRWNECSNGIHFFITRQEAVNY